MGSGNHDRAGGPEEMIADRLWKRTVPNLAVEHLLELGIAARDRVADDHQIEIRADVLRCVALQRRDLLLGQKIAHRRIDVLVRSPHVVATTLEQRGERGHRGSADPNQVNPFHDVTAASSIITAGRDPATTRARTPNGSVRQAPVVCPDGSPNSTGPGKSARTRATTPRAVTPPSAGSSQRGSSPNTNADGRASQPDSRSF